MKRAVIAVVLGVVSAAIMAGPAPPPPVDVVTVGTVSGASGGTVDVPVFIRDTSGTPLGIDQPAGMRIQSYAITVNYSPASAVQSITFTRGGVTAPLTPTFESSPSGPGTVTLIDTFSETTNLIPFTSNAPAPGTQIGVLHVAVSPAAPIGSTINLTLDATLTQLNNQGGTTTESMTIGGLTLVNGAINVTTSIPALSTWALLLLAIAVAVTALMTLRK
jgi:IPTL-CTERM motif